MDLRNLTAPARRARTALGVGAAITALGLFAADAAFAQQQPQQPQRQPQQPQRPSKPPQKPAAQPAQAPAPAAPAPAAAGAPQAETPPLIYSPWTKVCGKEGQQPGGPQKEVCFTIKEARLDTGQFVASAGLIELEGEQKKILRVTLPLGLLLRHGTRMIVDANQPMTGVYNFCLPNGCWADFDVNPDFVKSLKGGSNLVLQAFNLNGQVASFNFPLADFSKSNEGPPTDPKALEEQQKKLQAELEERAKAARERLEKQGQPQGGQPAQPAQPPR